MAANGPRSAPSSARSTTVRVRRIISSATSTGRPSDAIACHSCRGVSRRLGHHAGQRGDALTMKGRLRDAALPQPEVVFAGQQAVADRHPQLLVERALVIVAGVVLQDVADIGGVGDEIAAPRADLEVDDVAEAARGAHEDAGRIASDRRQHAEDRQAREGPVEAYEQTRPASPACHAKFTLSLMAPISRHEFLQRTAMAGAACLLSSVEGFAIAQQKKIRVGVIGCGSVSGSVPPPPLEVAVRRARQRLRHHLRARQKRAAEFNVPNTYPHIDKMLAGPPFDLMVTLTDMQEHGRLNKQALDAGRHVWSEKPLANTYEEGRALLDLAKSKKLRIWGAPAVVNSPQFAFMSKTIREGKLGRISSAHAHYGHTGPTWSAFFYEKGGGSLPDLGVYNLATLTGLLGPAKAVIAMTSIVTPERTVDNKGRIKVEAEDNAMVLMDHGEGVMSHVQCGFNYFDPYGHQGKGQDQHTITIWGTQGNMGLVGYDWAPFGVDLATHDHEDAGALRARSRHVCVAAGRKRHLRIAGHRIRSR